MAQFKYKACDSKGHLKNGRLEAEDTEEVKRFLAGDGLRAIEIKNQGALTKDIKFKKSNGTSPKKLVRFCRGFSAIYNAGIPMVNALELLQKQTPDQQMKNALHRVIKSVESGSSLSDSMHKEHSVFPEMLCEMAGVGEKTGNLPDNLDRMAEYYEKTARTRSAVVKAMIYPAIVSVVVIAVIIVIMTNVIPRFEAIFAASGSELPGITKMLMAVCNFLAGHLIPSAVVLAALVFLLIAFSRTSKGKYFFGNIARKLPLLKSFTEKNSSAMFARTLSNLLSSGIPILDALDIASANIKNIYFRDAVLKTKENIRLGIPLSDSIERTGVFPFMIIQMISIGENSGNLNDMLEKSADYYDEETENASQALLAALEPTLMIFLIFIVAVIVFAVALPMFSLYSNMLH